MKAGAVTAGTNDPPRVLSVDAARGLVIIGVVLNHAVDGLLRSGALPANSTIAQLNAALYVFRMPTLVFLVGLFAPAGVRKFGASRYALRRGTLLVYLLLVWQVVEGILEILAGSHRNGTTEVRDVLTVWQPLAHLWFLPFLAAGTALCAAVRAWERSRWQQWAILAALAAVATATWGWHVRYAGSNGASLLFFLVAGSVVGMSRMPTRTRPRTGTAVVAVGVLSAAFVLLVRSMDLGPATQPGALDLPQRIMSLLAAATGLGAVLFVSALVARVPGPSRVLAFVGRRTLAIYLGHLAVVAGCRVALQNLGAGPVTVLLVAVPVAVVVCLGLHQAGNRYPFRWLLHLPRGLPFAAGTSARCTPPAGPVAGPS